MQLIFFIIFYKIEVEKYQVKYISFKADMLLTNFYCRSPFSTFFQATYTIGLLQKKNKYTIEKKLLQTIYSAW